MSCITNFSNLSRPVVDIKATGNKIKQLMTAKSLCVRDLQAVFGFGYPQAVYAWIEGKSLPSVDNLLVLSQIFCVLIDEIVQRKFVGCAKSA